jgi:hypothetical protein
MSWCRGSQLPSPRTSPVSRCCWTTHFFLQEPLQAFDHLPASLPITIREIRFSRPPEKTAPPETLEEDAKLVLQYDVGRGRGMIALAKDELDENVLRAHVESIEAKVEEIRRLCVTHSPRNFYFSMQGRLREIREHIESMARVIGGGSGHRCKTVLLALFEPFADALADKIEMPDAERRKLEMKTAALWQGQARAHDTLMTTPAFNKVAKRCYFSYASATTKHQHAEQWVQPFLERLRAEMEAMGVRALMDTQDRKPGDNPQTFMREGVGYSHAVFVFCTRSLIEKLHSEDHNKVKTEMAMMLQRPVIPVLLTGTRRSAVPIELQNRVLLDARDFASYEAFVAGLIKALE